MVYLYYGLGKGYNGKRGFKQPGVATSYKTDFGRPPFSNINFGNQFIHKTEATGFTPMRTGDEGYISASLSVTEAQDIVAGTAKGIVSAAIIATDPIDVLAGTAKDIISTSLVATDLIDTALITAKDIVNSSFAITEQADLLAMTSDADVSAAIIATDPIDVLAFTAVAGTARNATANMTEPQDRASMLARGAGRHGGYYVDRQYLINQQKPEIKLPIIDVDIFIEENRDRISLVAETGIVSTFAASEGHDIITMELYGHHDQRYADNEIILFLMAA